MAEAVTIPTENKGPSLEDEAAALEAKVAEAAKAEPQLEGEEPATERPEWLPAKFDTVEDMAKAYAELEKGQSAPKAVAEAAEEAVEKAGLDMDALSAEYADKGELTPESLEALSKAGITPEMVNSYIAGQTAQSDAARAALLGPVGGEEAYTDMVTWAGDNLADGDIDAFNKVLEAGDPNAVKMAVENLHTKYTAANGSEPARQLIGKQAAGSTVYESTADMLRDMGNPEYAKNPAFRAKVEAKLARSNIM
tara:strand:- start:102 stop:857 length:756 start_codon:yes stop_codon:yes gene_type:complete